MTDDSMKIPEHWCDSHRTLMAQQHTYDGVRTIATAANLCAECEANRMAAYPLATPNRLIPKKAAKGK